MDSALLDARPILNEVMWKRLRRGPPDVAAIIADATGMDYYTNETGALILECISKGLTVGEILALMRQARGAGGGDEDALEFLRLLEERRIITLQRCQPQEVQP